MSGMIRGGTEVGGRETPTEAGVSVMSGVQDIVSGGFGPELMFD